MIQKHYILMEWTFWQAFSPERSFWQIPLSLTLAIIEYVFAGQLIREVFVRKNHAYDDPPDD